MKLIRNLLKLKYTGKILSGFFAVLQTWVTYYIMTKASSLVKNDTLSMGIIFTTLSFVVFLLSLVKDHISTHLDINSDYNKEKAAHSNTNKDLKKTKNELEEKKDLIHSMVSSFNNTFLTKKSGADQVAHIKKILSAINSEKKVSNCGNSKMATTEEGGFLREFLNI